MKLIDIGANLTHSSFEKDFEQVLERAKNAGVHKIIVTGSDLDESRKAFQLARKYPGFLYSTAGYHPHQATLWNEDSSKYLLELLENPEVVAVGECGLDYFRNFSPPSQQRKAFQEQLALSQHTAKPYFLHQRDAHDDFYAMLREFRPHLSKAVVHCFTGTGRELEKYLELDLYIGITGWICDERRGYHLRDIVHLIPLNRLMIETDAPYLLPRDLPDKPKNRRNEPAFLPHILNTIAEILKIDPEELAEKTYQTTIEFFSLE